MKVFSAECRAAMAAGDIMRHGAVYIATSPTPLAVWGGYGTLVLDEVEFIGIGDRGLVSVSASALGAAAQNIDLTFSGIDPEIVSLDGMVNLRDAPCVLYRLYFNGSGSTLLDAHVYARGRLDQLVGDDQLGGSATVTATIETAARGLGKRGARMRSHADQTATFADDDGFRAVSYAGQKTLYWGGERPAQAKAALPGSSSAPTFSLEDYVRGVF